MQSNWTIPGTTLTGQRENADRVDGLFQSLFLAGGLSLSQVSKITGLEPYTIQNWVKRGFLTPPEHKRYTMHQLCRIININMLKAALSLGQICGLLSYVNGDLSDESDDLIDDATLYFLFVRLAADHRRMNTPEGRDAYLSQLLSEQTQLTPDAKARVAKVLTIMLTAWAASQLRLSAEVMVKDLK